MSSARTVRFLGEDCSVQFARYGNGRTAIVLLCEDHSPMAKATVNVPEAELGPGEVIVKDHSENSGMLAALETAGILKATGRMIPSGFVVFPVAKLLVEP